MKKNYKKVAIGIAILSLITLNLVAGETKIRKIYNLSPYRMLIKEPKRDVIVESGQILNFTKKPLTIPDQERLFVRIADKKGNIIKEYYLYDKDWGIWDSTLGRLYYKKFGENLYGMDLHFYDVDMVFTPIPGELLKFHNHPAQIR
jgi:hypothetical protein